MAQLEINSLSFTYPDGEAKSLTDISFTIQEGDFVILCGSTDSGKSTLLQHLKKETQPTGRKTGDILYQGEPFECFTENGTVEEIGVVFQDPENQIVMDTVSQELAFALENIGCPPSDMSKRIGEMVQFFGIEAWFHSPIQELSGGQKQILNLASVLLLQPKLLLLDEPTSQLDPVAAKEFLQLVKRINEEFSTSIVISEHRLPELFPYANHVILMAEGRIVYQGEPRQFIHEIWREHDHLQQHFYIHYIPRLSKTYLQTTPQSEVLPERIPLTVKEGRRWINKEGHTLEVEEMKRRRSNPTQLSGKRGAEQKSASIFSCEDVFFQYTRDGRRILNGLHTQIAENEIVAILGGNGTGKSTLLKILLGLLKPQKGRVLLKEEPVLKIKEKSRFQQVGFLDQNPKLYFVHDTVEQVLAARASQLSKAGMSRGEEKDREWLQDDEMKSKSLIKLWTAKEGSAMRKVGGESGDQDTSQKDRIERLVEELRIPRNCMRRHPYDLSGGEQQKLALALVLMAEPSILLLDEPTKGLDPYAKKILGQLLNDLKQQEQQAQQKQQAKQSQQKQGTQSDLEDEATQQTITFTIIGPEDVGTILEDIEVEFKEGETVLDTLKRVTREQKIQMEYRGRKATAYIEGINNIYEFDYGAESGWLYSVNGVFPNRGAGVWPVEANDHIRWLYTVDLGRDWDAYIPDVDTD